MSTTRDYIFIGDFSQPEEIEAFLKQVSLRIYEKDDLIYRCLFSGLLPEDLYEAYEEFHWKNKPRIVVINDLPYHENIKMIEEPGVQFDFSLRDWHYEIGEFADDEED